MNLRQLLFSQDHNFYTLLKHQAETVKEGMLQFTTWDGSDPEYAARVVHSEELADTNRLQVSAALSKAFSTPIDREDIDDLSHLLDDIMDQARRAASELSALEVAPDPSLTEMFQIISEGMEHLVEACSDLSHRCAGTRDSIRAAKAAEGRMQRVYENALKLLFSQDDVKLILRKREVYRLTQDIAVDISHAGEFLQRLTLKMI